MARTAVSASATPTATTHKRDLDDDYRNGENERTVGLAEMAGEGIGMAYHADGAPSITLKIPKKKRVGGIRSAKIDLGRHR